jgi:hypothetical protein
MHMLTIAPRVVGMSLCLALCGLCAVGCTRVADGYCRAAGACDIGLDGVGESDDSVAVCIEREEGALRSLRRNDEPECLDAADKYEAYLVCAGASYAKDADGCVAIGEACAQELVDANNANPLTTGRNTCTEFQE